VTCAEVEGLPAYLLGRERLADVNVAHLDGVHLLQHARRRHCRADRARGAGSLPPRDTFARIFVLPWHDPDMFVCGIVRVRGESGRGVCQRVRAKMAKLQYPMCV
jgi:hypothetical protein